MPKKTSLKYGTDKFQVKLPDHAGIPGINDPDAEITTSEFKTRVQRELK